MGRTPCCDKNGLKKGPWTSEEDLLLTQYVQVHGPGNWRALPKDAGLKRCGKSCRLRWTNYLRPDIKRGRFAFEEEEAIIQLHSVLGNKWSTIAARLPGRTDNEIKNYWNTHIRKRLLRMGIDPVTHGPRLDLLELSSILGRNNPSDLNTLSSLLGVQSSPPPINPEWYLTLANTILSLKQRDPEILLRKIQQENQILLNSQLENQILSSLQFQPNSSFPIATNAPASATTSTAPQPNVENSSQLQQHSQENLIPSNWNADFQSLEIGNPNFGFDSVMSTPLSSPGQVNSSTAIRHSGTEDERESYCSDLLMKFEIPESLDICEFL